LAFGFQKLLGDFLALLTPFREFGVILPRGGIEFWLWLGVRVGQRFLSAFFMVLLLVIEKVNPPGDLGGSVI
jgi:hypothetical protein